MSFPIPKTSKLQTSASLFQGSCRVSCCPEYPAVRAPTASNEHGPAKQTRMRKKTRRAASALQSPRVKNEPRRNTETQSWESCLLYICFEFCPTLKGDASPKNIKHVCRMFILYCTHSKQKDSIRPISQMELWHCAVQIKHSCWDVLAFTGTASPQCIVMASGIKWIISYSQCFFDEPIFCEDYCHDVSRTSDPPLIWRASRTAPSTAERIPDYIPRAWHNLRSSPVGLSRTSQLVSMFGPTRKSI